MFCFAVVWSYPVIFLPAVRTIASLLSPERATISPPAPTPTPPQKTGEGYIIAARGKAEGNTCSCCQGEQQTCYFPHFHEIGTCIYYFIVPKKLEMTAMQILLVFSDFILDLT